jgi:hypothetical protein
MLLEVPDTKNLFWMRAQCPIWALGVSHQVLGWMLAYISWFVMLIIKRAKMILQLFSFFFTLFAIFRVHGIRATL